MRVEADGDENLGRVTTAATLSPGETLRVVKLVAYGWSGERSVSALRNQVAGALATARHAGWDGICREQRDYLDGVWRDCDLSLDGDAQLQFGVRFAIFQVLHASALAELRAIAAKGLTGLEYDGHTFWDIEADTMRVLTYLEPAAARDALCLRHATLAPARDRARVLGPAGVTFPWRTIARPECSGCWPASTAAFHLNAAAIADHGAHLTADLAPVCGAMGRARPNRACSAQHPQKRAARR
jgi:alpha,alpha-trehalose phosphorylase